MNAREAVDVFARFADEALTEDSEAKVRTAAAVLARLVEVADDIWHSEFGPWRSALGAALDGGDYPPPRKATSVCEHTTVPCGFASCEVHYGRPL